MEKLAEIREKHRPGIEKALASAEAELGRLTSQREELVKTLQQDQLTSRIAKNTCDAMNHAGNFLPRSRDTDADWQSAHNLHTSLEKKIPGIEGRIREIDKRIAKTQATIAPLREFLTSQDEHETAG